MHCLSLRLSDLNIHEGGSSESNDRMYIAHLTKKMNDKHPLMAPNDHFPVHFNLNELVYKS